MYFLKTVIKSLLHVPLDQQNRLMLLFMSCFPGFLGSHLTLPFESCSVLHNFSEVCRARQDPLIQGHFDSAVVQRHLDPPKPTQYLLIYAHPSALFDLHHCSVGQVPLSKHCDLYILIFRHCSFGESHHSISLIFTSLLGT